MAKQIQAMDIDIDIQQLIYANISIFKVKVIVSIIDARCWMRAVSM